MGYEHISIDHRIMAGVPCIKGTRVPVASVVGMIADGMSVDEIRSDFPQLTAIDVQEALHFAADAVRERELPLKEIA